MTNKTREWCTSIDMTGWEPMPRTVVEMAIAEFDQLTALQAEGYEVDGSLPRLARCWNSNKRAHEPKPAPTRYGKPSLTDFRKPDDWGNA